jgi:protein TonB
MSSAFAHSFSEEIYSRRPATRPTRLQAIAQMPAGTQPQSGLQRAPQQYRDADIAIPHRLTDWLILGFASLLLHGLFIGNWLHAPRVEEAPVETVKIPMMTIELTRPAPPQPAAPAQPQPKVPSKTVAPTKAVSLHPSKIEPKPTPAESSTPQTENPAPASASAPSSASASTSAAVSDLPVTPPMGRAGYLSNPAPKYPELALKRGWTGEVLLHVHVLASGRPDRVEVQRSAGRKPLDDAAVSTVQGWIFAPAHRGAIAVDGWVTVPIEFKLDE